MADKARFLRHLRPWWEMHGHRMAGPVADRIDAAIAGGQLKLYGCRIQSFDMEQDQVTLRYRVRGTDRMEQIAAARVINCSGPGADYARISHPLIRGRLFAVGPVTKAAFWEMTAVPDIRRQCEYLANHLSVLAKTVRPRVAEMAAPW